MGNIFNGLKSLFVFIFLKNFFKILMVVILSVILFLVLFPKKELSDFASKTVAEASGYRVRFDFDDLSFSSANGLGIQLDQVYLEMVGQSPITLKQLAASPDLMAAIKQKPYGRIKALGLFNGEGEITISKHKQEADSGDIKEEQSLIAVNASRLDLASLKTFLHLPFEMNGQADLNAKVISLFQLTPPEDPKLAAAPFQLLGVPELTITIKNFDMPPFLLEKGMLMPVNVPGLKFSEVVLKGRLYENTFQIQELLLGRPNDELSGTITGKLTLTKGPVPQLERYEVTTNLKFRQSFRDKIESFLILIRPELIKPFSGGYEFKSKISGVMYGSPSFGPAQ